MRIAIDFDDTFSSDVAMWRQIVELMLKQGHDVRIVTARGEEGRRYTLDNGEKVTVRKNNNVDIYKAIEGLGISVMYCAWQGKRTTCAHRGWHPQIWIDDMPEAIVESGILQPWKHEIKAFVE